MIYRPTSFDASSHVNFCCIKHSACIIPASNTEQKPFYMRRDIQNILLWSLDGQQL